MNWTEALRKLFELQKLVDRKADVVYEITQLQQDVDSAQKMYSSLRRRGLGLTDDRIVAADAEIRRPVRKLQKLFQERRQLSMQIAQLVTELEELMPRLDEPDFLPMSG